MQRHALVGLAVESCVPRVLELELELSFGVLSTGTTSPPCSAVVPSFGLVDELEGHFAEPFTAPEQMAGTIGA